MSRTQNIRSKQKKKYLIVTGILVMLLMTAGAFFALGYQALSKAVDKTDYEETHNAQWDIDPTVAEQLEDYRNILVLGVDARSMTQYDGSRSDAILILSIHKKTGAVKMISLMRDTYLEMYNREGELVLDKITHAHSVGGGVAASRSLNRSLDLNIQEYAIFNWKAVADVVDAFGGVEVEVKGNELHDLNKYGPETGEAIGRSYETVRTSGVQILDGVQAASYCRIRKTSGGDSQRAERMKKVLTAIFSEAKGMGLSELKQISSDALPQIRTNMDSNAIIGMLVQLGTFHIDQNIGLPYEYKGGMFHGGWYAVPRTLETNVVRLHLEAFGQEAYVPSATLAGISNRIIEDTGINILE